MSLRAAAVSRFRCTSMSSTSPSLSTARQSQRDQDGHFVEVPCRAWARPRPAEITRVQPTELEHPAPDRLVRDVEAPLSHEFLHISVAQREPDIEPDSMPDDLRRKAMTYIGDGLHPSMLSRA